MKSCFAFFPNEYHIVSKVMRDKTNVKLQSFENKEGEREVGSRQAGKQGDLPHILN